MNFHDSLLAVGNIITLGVYSAEILFSVSLFKAVYLICFFSAHSKRSSKTSLLQLKTALGISGHVSCCKFTQYNKFTGIGLTILHIIYDSTRDGGASKGQKETENVCSTYTFQMSFNLQTTDILLGLMYIPKQIAKATKEYLIFAPETSTSSNLNEFISTADMVN